MLYISESEYMELVKKERNIFFKNSFDRAYHSFVKLGFDKKEPSFFVENASQIVEEMREQCWNDFLEEESLFTVHMLKKLIHEETVNKFRPKEAVEWYVETYPNHIYALNLSNTQSRRSRAGKEFENIIELILLGAGVSLDSQGNIGKDCFMDKGLGKLVDTVSPGVIEFEENKRNTVLISAKTTLRERWQEVPEEMGRTGAREMFLATLDEKISNDVLRTLYEANIQVTTTKKLKETKYSKNNAVLSFEELIKICLENSGKWNSYIFKKEQLEQAVLLSQKQIDKHEEHDFVKERFTKRLTLYKEKLQDLLK